MASTIDKETFRRLAILYLIDQFPNGIFSSFRLQKVLYYATRDVEPKPFTFHHTRYGQYSHDAGVQLTLMLESGFVKRDKLNGERSGALWQVGDKMKHVEVTRSFEQGFPQLVSAFREAIADYGFMKQRELDERVHADPILKEKPSGRVLIAAIRHKRVPCELDDVESEDLELMLSTELFSFVGHRTQEIADATFTTGASPT